MHRVAYLTSAQFLNDTFPEPKEQHEHELQVEALQRACELHGIALRPVAWTDPVDPGACDGVVIGTVWDYADRPEDFLACLEAWSELRPLFNPLATVRWNLNKTYLRDLATTGVPIVPTLWRERADPDTLAAAFEELGTDAIVAKPVVGQSSWRLAHIRRGAPLPDPEALPPAETMLQPFLPSVQTEGELSIVCFDRVVSHCARKHPAAGDCRTQACHGGRQERHEPTAAELELVERVLASVEGPILHTRIDLIRGLDGELAVMELELIEPYLFPEQGGGAGGMGERFAEALSRMLSES